MRLAISSKLASVMLLFGITAASLPSFAKSVSSELFDVDFYRLDNQIPVISKPLQRNDRFTLQLIVDVGLMDFPCKDRQTPHVLEHMLFEGTKTFSGPELRARIFDKGGKWEGYTTDEYTHYTLHIHANYADTAIDTLYRMVTEPKFNNDTMENSKRSVNAERGIPNNLITELFDDTLPIADRGKARLYTGTNLDCSKKAPVKHLKLKDVKTLFDKYYVPENMTLIALGHFDPAKIKQQLNDTLGKLPQAEMPSRAPLELKPYSDDTIIERQGINQSETHVQMYIRSVGVTDPNSIPWQVIDLYLNERLFEEIRQKRGIGYTPRSRYVKGESYGHIIAQVKTTSEWYKDVEALFRSIYQDLKTNGIPTEDIERLKKQLIFKFETKERKNFHIAQMYRHQRKFIAENGYMRNTIEEIKSIDKESIDDILATLPSTPLIGLLRPPESHEIALRIGGIILLSALLALPLFRLLRKRRVNTSQT